MDELSGGGSLAMAVGVAVAVALGFIGFGATIHMPRYLAVSRMREFFFNLFCS